MHLRELDPVRQCGFCSQSDIGKPPHVCTLHTLTTHNPLANHHSTMLTRTTMQSEMIQCVSVHNECHSPTTHFRPCRATLAPIRGSLRRPPPPTSILSHSVRAAGAVRAGSMIRSDRMAVAELLKPSIIYETRMSAGKMRRLRQPRYQGVTAAG